MTKSEIAKEVIERYLKVGKGVSKHYLAKVLCNEYPEVFTSHENARKVIRYITGSNRQM